MEATDPGSVLTLSNVLAICALCLAVTGVAVGPLWALLSRTRKRLNEVEAKATQSLREIPAHQETLAEVAGRGFAGSASSLEFSAGLLHRIMSDRVDEIEPELAVHQLRLLRTEVERAWMELRLLTGNRTEQTSALQQLASIGDGGTERFLEWQLRDDGLGGPYRDKLEHTLRTIRRRRTSSRRG